MTRTKRHASRGPEPKARVLHTRIPESLEEAIKDRAEKLRIPVSNLVRNVLEQTFQLVEDVVGDSLEIADAARRGAERVREAAQGAARDARARRETEQGQGGGAARPEGPPTAPMSPRDSARATAPPASSEADDLDADGAFDADVYAWQEIVLNRAAPCRRCGRSLARGASAYRALTDAPASPAVVVCEICLEEIRADDADEV